jgi:hypothetical protein
MSVALSYPMVVLSDWTQICYQCLTQLTTLFSVNTFFFNLQGCRSLGFPPTTLFADSQ